jgi:AraC-like DNA-binding protein
VTIRSEQPDRGLKDMVKELYYIHLKAKDEAKRIPVIDDCCYDFVMIQKPTGEMTFGLPASNIPIASKVFTIHALSPPYKIHFTDHLTLFTIKLQPWFNAHFFSGLSGSGVLDIAPMYPQTVHWHQQMFQDIPLDERFLVANRFLAQMTTELAPSMELVKAVCEYVDAQKGIVSVEEISQYFGKSRQYLLRVFKREVMYSLKRYVTTVRILDLVKYKAKHPALPLTTLSYEYGYFDQAHFIHDFKKICGVKPSLFFDRLPEFFLRHQ